MKLKELLSELDKLNIPKDKMAITSSGPLGVRNIREIGDLDIIVYPEIWRKLSQKYVVTKEEKMESMEIGNIQILGGGSWFTDPKYGDIETDIDNADVIDGNRYVTLEKILTIKRQKNRPKDIADVKLIENYLSAEK